MKIFAIAEIKNEADIIGYNVEYLFEQGIDGMIVADNNSTDETRDILVDLMKKHKKLTVIEDEEVRSFQWQVYTGLALSAKAMGADWIVPFDADELFCTSDHDLITKIRYFGYKDMVLSIPMLNYFATGLDDPNEKNPFKREQWRKKEPNPLNKVIFKWFTGATLASGQHFVSLDDRPYPSTVCPEIVIRHYQNRSPAHLIRKIRAEAEIDKFGRHDCGYWYKFGKMSDQEITEWWKKDYFFPDPVKSGLVHDPLN